MATIMVGYRTNKTRDIFHFQVFFAFNIAVIVGLQLSRRLSDQTYVGLLILLSLIYTFDIHI